MSKADEALSTSACPVPTRRAFLCQTGCMAGAAIAATGTAQAAPTVAQPSDLFREYLEARDAFLEAYGTIDVKTETPAGKALQRTVDDRLDRTVKALKARRPAGVQDMIELAQVAVNEMADDWAFEAQYAFDFEESLARGLLALAEGGANV